MSQNASGPQVQQSPGDRESLAAGDGLTPTVAQPAADIDPGDIVQLWADAKGLYFAGVYPKYASPAWLDLEPDDPKRLAAALDAAEKWRKYGDEEALLQWFRDATAPKPPLWTGRTLAELAEARKPKRPHQLQATPGWPPIAIPGKPGRYLTYQHQEAA